jgi:uncharacterized repeat protein (TIGR01451 family)
VINYAIGLTNDGNMDLTNAVVTDPSVSDLAAVMSGGFNVGDTNMDGDLSLGETWQYTADHTVTQAEIDNGGVVDPALAFSNTASATTDQGATDTATAPVSIAQHPSFTLTKAGTVNDTNGNGVPDAGETISYTFTEHNTGNMTLTNVAVSDQSSGVTVSGSPIATLALGATDGTTITGSYTITQADIDAGFKDNTAVATSNQTPSVTATAHVPLTQNAHVSLSETAALQHSGPPSAGDPLVYEFSLENDGNVTLHDPTVNDPTTTGVTAELDSHNINLGDTNGNLLFDVGETWLFTGTHTITDAEFAAGMVTDTSSTGSALFGPLNQLTNTATASVTFAIPPH